MTTHTRSLWNPALVRTAVIDALGKLDPRTMLKNPVMFVVEAGAVLTTVLLARDIAGRRPDIGFELQITLWLWATVLFANFAEAMAEGRGKAQPRIAPDPTQARCQPARRGRRERCRRRRCAGRRGGVAAV